jgi:hypothetical protein
MGVRFLTAAGLLLGFLALRRGWRALRVTWRELRAAAVVGTLLLLLGNGLVAIAEQTVPSGLAALIVGAVPLWFVLLRVAAVTGPPADLVGRHGRIRWHRAISPSPGRHRVSNSGDYGHPGGHGAGRSVRTCRPGWACRAPAGDGVRDAGRWRDHDRRRPRRR